MAKKEEWIRAGFNLVGGVLVPVAQAVQVAEPAKKRLRQDTKPLLNKLETEFFNWIDSVLRAAYSHPVIMPQSLRFKLGNGIWYKPDFVFIRPEGTWTCYEVKGPRVWRGGFENLKVAAHKYPLIQWMLAYKESGSWVAQEIMS